MAASSRSHSAFSEHSGGGQQKGYHETYRGVDIEVNLLKRVRLEIAVNEDFVEATGDAIG